MDAGLGEGQLMAIHFGMDHPFGHRIFIDSVLAGRPYRFWPAYQRDRSQPLSTFKV